MPCRLVFQHWFRRSIVPEHPWLVALRSQSQPASTLSCFRYTRYTRRKLQEHWLASDHGAKYVTASDHADIPRQPICVQWISLKNTVLNRYTKVKIVLIIDFKTWHRDKNIKQFVILNWIMITFNYKTNFFCQKTALQCWNTNSCCIVIYRLFSKYNYITYFYFIRHCH